MKRIDVQQHRFPQASASFFSPKSEKQMWIVILIFLAFLFDANWYYFREGRQPKS